MIEEHARRLVDVVEAALPAWVEACVRRRGGEGVASSAATAEAAGRAVAEVVPVLRAVVEADVDEQRTTPLAVLRGAVRYPTEVLAAAGVAPVERDDFARQRFPDDPYDLTPATFADLSPEVGDAGIAWGAAKAFVHKQRHGGGA